MDDVITRIASIPLRYMVVYINDHTGDYTPLGSSDQLSAAASMRVVSGDLIFDSVTGEICQDESWLFEWERQDLACYARWCMTVRSRIYSRETMV